jgi:hypothetical protein
MIIWRERIGEMLDFTADLGVSGEVYCIFQMSSLRISIPLRPFPVYLLYILIRFLRYLLPLPYAELL